MSTKWSLDQQGVSVDWMTASTTKSGQFSRKMKLTSARLRLTHVSTGINVTGEVPKGHYSKKEMRRLQDELYEKMFAKLETLVRQRLRVPGK